MKKIIIAILFFTLTISVNAQFSIGYSVGYGTYDMGDMKDMLKDMQKVPIQTPDFQTTELQLYIVDKFPGYITHQIEAGYKLKRHEFGLKFMYMTTGGKLSLADYSGEYNIKAIMNGFKQEAFYRYYLLSDNQPFNFYLDVVPGIVINNFKLKENIKLYDGDSASDNINMHGVNFSVTPAIGASYRINSLLAVRASAGYEINFPNAELEKDDYKLYYKSNWSGLRLSAGVSLYFK
ncbi:hypothetical protein [Bacteroides sp. 519]|uniref:hypothetical protein n=1 Tax=Bacteroides sp. 519 TaxID=2302937 RepID=UPI0013D33EF2|nr:hypothetical protein [Bacteroides sp. 519]NDV59351.1 hypothetical protein [Bacteroides sp. 519]